MRPIAIMAMTAANTKMVNTTTVIMARALPLAFVGYYGVRT